MATEDLWDASLRLLKTSPSGADLFRESLRAAELDFKSRGEDFGEFLSPESRIQLQNELKRKSQQLVQTAANIANKKTRGMWLGLFEEARSSGYKLTTYLGTFDRSPDEDETWENSIKIYKPSYTPLHALTKAHRKPKNCSAASANALYIYLPIAFLAAIILDISKQEKLQKIEEFGFGWDSGDFAKWRPGTPALPLA